MRKSKFYTTEKLNELSNQLHEFQIEAGFSNGNITQRLMLVITEITEAFEAFRKDKYARLEFYNENPETNKNASKEEILKESFELCIKDTLEDEIADAVIRLLAFCGENEIDIEYHIQQKMRYNHLRGHKFGGKKF